ncbi:amidohydrolase, partial [Candidatus Bathyarchaeota archaeon]
MTIHLMAGVRGVEADLALIGGKIVTMDGGESIAEAVTVKYGRIIRVGSTSEVEPLIGGGTAVIDLRGRTVVPGFIDSHGHILRTGADRMLNVDLSQEAGVRSIADIVERLRERADETPAGGWVVGYQEDDSKLQEKRHPTRWDLDEASTEHPIIISTVGGHFYVANSLAFENAGVSKDTPDPVGGRFDRDPETGEPTGGFHEKAFGVIKPDGPEEPTREQSYEGAKQILGECAAAGITCIYDSGGRSSFRAALDLKNRGELPVRVRLDAVIGLFPDLNRLGIYRGMGDDWVRLCGLKFFFDGAISA